MHPLARDLDHVLAHTAGVWDELRDARIFVTGGTGFFGCWLLESWRVGMGADGPERVDDGADAVGRCVPRERRRTWRSHRSIRLVEGDVRSFHLPAARFTHVIHAASDATPQLCSEQPLLVLDTIVDGTRRVLDFAVESGREAASVHQLRRSLWPAAVRHVAHPRDLYRWSRSDGTAECVRRGQAYGRDVVHRLRATV